MNKKVGKTTKKSDLKQRDVGIAVIHNLKRLEKRINAITPRIYSQLGEIEEKLDTLIEEIL